MLAPGVVVEGVGIGAAELVAGQHIEALAALELEAAASQIVGYVMSRKNREDAK